ncbi:MAG: Fic family protein [Erysipelotrichaceae bacterium]|nr:Fic family protein [Erysipelotrichaceae bacterium]
MHKYDYSFLKDLNISARLISLTNTISEINTRSVYQKERYPEVFHKLVRISTVDSTVSSNAIEGIATDEKRIKDLFEKNENPLNHDEKQIIGYSHALKYISEHEKELRIDEKTICFLHSMIIDNDKIGGIYKKIDNTITRFYENGEREVIFEPVGADDVKENMRRMLMAFREAYNDSDINNMLLLPCFIVDFLAIHPFSDGNGRLSRLLTLLILYQEGYDIGKYISYEKEIENYKWNYYEELRKSQIGWHENENDYSSFIIFHYQILYRCYKKISELINEDDLSLSKAKRIEKTIMNSVIPISKNEISEKLPDVSITTIEKALSDLIKDNKIRKIGDKRNARYIQNEVD